MINAASGSMEKVKGSIRAKAIVAVKPGRAPTMIPPATPRTINSRLTGSNKEDTISADNSITFHRGEIPARPLGSHFIISISGLCSSIFPSM